MFESTDFQQAAGIVFTDRTQWGVRTVHSPQPGTRRLGLFRQAKLTHPCNKDFFAAAASVFALSDCGHALVGGQTPELLYLLIDGRQLGLSRRDILVAVLYQMLELSLTFQEDMKASDDSSCCLWATGGART